MKEEEPLLGGSSHACCSTDGPPAAEVEPSPDLLLIFMVGIHYRVQGREATSRDLCVEASNEQETPQQSSGLKVASAAQSKGPSQHYMLLRPFSIPYSRE